METRTKLRWGSAVILTSFALAGCGTRVGERPANEAVGRRPATDTPEGHSTTDATTVAAATPLDRPAAAATPEAGTRADVAIGAPSRTSVGRGSAPTSPVGAGQIKTGGQGGDDGGRATTPTTAPSGGPSAAPAGSAVPTPTAGDASPIIIGSVGNYSGPAGAAQFPGAQALQVWVKLANTRGGVAGHAIRLIVVDDGGDPARHQATVKDLVENKGVMAFVAQYASLTHQGAAAYLAKKRVPVVGGEVSLTLWNENPMYFPQSAATEHAAFGRVHAARRFAKGTKLAGLFCVEAQVCKDFERFVAEAAPQVGFKLVYSGRGSLGQPDFTAECLQAKNAGADVLFALFDLNSVRRIATSCTRQDYHPQYVLALGTGDLTSQDEPAFEGATASVPSFPFVGADSPAIREYFEAFARFAPELKLSPIGSHGWAAAKLFEKAALTAGPAKPTSAALLDGLWSMHNETLGGLSVPLTFERDKPAPKSRCWFVMHIVNHRWTAPDGDGVTCRP